jgi:hypothetical protein
LLSTERIEFAGRSSHLLLVQSLSYLSMLKKKTSAPDSVIERNFKRHYWIIRSEYICV